MAQTALVAVWRSSTQGPGEQYRMSTGISEMDTWCANNLALKGLLVSTLKLDTAKDVDPSGYPTQTVMETRPNLQTVFLLLGKTQFPHSAVTPEMLVLFVTMASTNPVS